MSKIDRYKSYKMKNNIQMTVLKQHLLNNTLKHCLNQIEVITFKLMKTLYYP